MKKTIIALLAFSGLAVADVQYFDFGRECTAEAIGIASSGRSGSMTVINGSYSFTADKTITLSQTSSDKNEWCDPFSGTLPGIFSSETYADSLTTQATSGSTGVLTLAFTGLDNGLYALDVFGGLVGKDNLATMSITIVSGGDSVNWTNVCGTDTNGDWINSGYEISGNVVTIGGVDSANADKSHNQSSYASIAKGYQVSATNIEVTDGNLTLKVSGQGWNNSFARTVLNGVALQMVVPEPTTATLSLLALAGLAARRRRR